ncbi:MAG TPA: VOC family protein [Vulgatibacter sp.]|nr:VOC family protein [Vulgatibacter sp.]
MERPGFHHLAIQVHDLDRAEAFYCGLLGLPVIRRWVDEAGAPRAVWVGLGGEGFLALERCEREAAAEPFSVPEPGLHVLALSIDSDRRGEWEARLAAAGFAKERETPFTFFVRDPDGNRIGLSHFPNERRP